MSWSRIDVYEFLRIHDELNFRHDDEINEFDANKNHFESLRESREVKGIHERTNEFDEFIECNAYIEFRKNRRNDIDALRSIHEALRVIHEALEEIEKNRIRKGIRLIKEGIRDTKEGVKEMIRI